MASVQTKDYIVQLMKEEILSGVMKPGEELAQDKIAYYFEQSKKYLDAVNVPPERKEELAKYAQKTMKRPY